MHKTWNDQDTSLEAVQQGTRGGLQVYNSKRENRRVRGRDLKLINDRSIKETWKQDGSAKGKKMQQFDLTYWCWDDCRNQPNGYCCLA